MDERQRIFKIHGEHGDYEGLIRLHMTFEGFVMMDVIADVSNESTGRKRVLNLRNDKLKRLNRNILPEYQETLIRACIDELEGQEERIFSSLEIKKIGFRLSVKTEDVIELNKWLELTCVPTDLIEFENFNSEGFKEEITAIVYGIKYKRRWEMDVYDVEKEKFRSFALDDMKEIKVIEREGVKVE